MQAGLPLELPHAGEELGQFILPGDASDPTRSPEYYDSTFNYLAGIGLSVLSSAFRQGDVGLCPFSQVAFKRTGLPATVSLMHATLKPFAALCALTVATFTSFTDCAAAPAAKPNVLFIIADDASAHFGQAYHCDWVKTPNIDQLAKVGLVFDRAYTPTSKCAPSRAAILTGRNPWQLEDAANHQPYFPAKFMAFSEALAKAGVHCGGAGKTWGPGEAKLADGSARDFALGKTAGAKGGANPGDWRGDPDQSQARRKVPGG